MNIKMAERNNLILDIDEETQFNFSPINSLRGEHVKYHANNKIGNKIFRKTSLISVEWQMAAMVQYVGSTKFLSFSNYREPFNLQNG